MPDNLQLEFLLDKAVGACAYGVAPLEVTPEEIMEAYTRWLEAGNSAGMDYLANHEAIRRDPELLLPGARSIISLAFSYNPPEFRSQTLPAAASYALGSDYHGVLRSRLRRAVNRLGEIFGGDYRICIDSAPILERYWAERCGVGKRADNGLIAVPGYGTRVFLAEILSTTILPEEAGRNLPGMKGWQRENGERMPVKKVNQVMECFHCGACRRACPAGALQTDSTVDARRCLSYLTIEHRGEWNVEGERAMSTPAGRHTLFGCDICQNVCPMNAPLNPAIPPTEIEEFLPRPGILTLTAEEVAVMTPGEFSRRFKDSPIKRTKFAGLLRNTLNILQRPGRDKD